MDFENFLQNEALRPLSIVYGRALLDCPETASVIARLPPPQIAMICHSALIRAPFTKGEGVRPQAAERLSARIMFDYGLGDAASQQQQQQHGAGSARMQTPPEVHNEFTANAAGSVLLPPFFLPTPLCCRHKYSCATFQHVEHAMALREVAFQRSVVESMMRMQTEAIYSAEPTLPEQEDDS